MERSNKNLNNPLFSKDDKYRRDIYRSFAEIGREKGLKWIVLHGAEDYPKKIGRDLDVLCKDKEEILKAIILFKSVAEKNTDTKWIISPNPLWGRRVLAISENYEVAELHILNKLNSGVISYTPNFDTVDYSVLFPADKGAFEFKGIVLPVLGNSRKVLNTVSDYRFSQLPSSVQKAYTNLLKNGKTTKLNKMLIYKTYVNSFTDMVANLRYSLILRRSRYSSPTTPLVLINSGDEFIKDEYFKILSELFLDFICGDDLNVKQIRFHQSRQLLIYFTKIRKDIKLDLLIGNIDVGLAALETVNAFSKYNNEKYQ